MNKDLICNFLDNTFKNSIFIKNTLSRNIVEHTLRVR